MIPAEDQQRTKCYKYCLRLLERKDYSRKKLNDKLILKGFDESTAQSVIEEMIQKKFLREDFYTEARIKGLMRKGYHPFAIQNRLFDEGCTVDQELILETFKEYQVDPTQEGCRLVRKKLLLSNMDQTLPHEPEELFRLKAKLTRFLISKGYPLELAKNCIQQELTI